MKRKKIRNRYIVNPDTAWHLTNWAKQLGYPEGHEGWVIDKLVREKALELKDGGNL